MPTPTDHKQSGKMRRFGLTRDEVYAVAAVAVVALTVLTIRLDPFDFWWHLAAGRTFAERGPWAAVSANAFTQPTATFFGQAWLAELLMVGLFRAGGPVLLIVVQAVLLSGVFGALLALMVRRAQGRVRASALLLIALVPAAAHNWGIRPQAYALLPFLVVLWTLTAYRLRWSTRLWPLAVAMLFWTNLHGSFVLGVVLMGIVVVVEGVRSFFGREGALSQPEWSRLAGHATLASLSTLLNPHGARIYGYTLGYAKLIASSDLCTEWVSPSPKTALGATFFLLMIGVFAILARARQKPDPTDLVMLFAFLWPALTAVRNILWFELVAAPVVAHAVRSLLPAEEGPTERSPAGAVLALVLASAVLGLLPLRAARSEGLDPYTDNTPVAAVEHLRRMPPERRPLRLFHNEAVGSYLLWAAPEQQVFIDPRFELYPQSQWNDLVRLDHGAEPNAVLRRYGVDGVLLLNAQTELATHLANDPSWTLDYRDDVAALYLPNGRHASN